MASREAAHGASIARRRLRKSARRDILPSFFLLAALSLVPTGASARSVTDACFWDPSDGTCSASATWVSENNLIHSKQGQFMARVLVAYEECALATNEGARCESLAGTCDWRAGSTEGTGECNLSARWMTKELQGCLNGDGAGAAGGESGRRLAVQLVSVSFSSLPRKLSLFAGLRAIVPNSVSRAGRDRRVDVPRRRTDVTRFSAKARAYTAAQNVGDRRTGCPRVLLRDCLRARTR